MKDWERQPRCKTPEQRHPDILPRWKPPAAREYPPPQRIWDVDGWLNALGVRLKTPAARFALETAALDVLARRAGVPLARLLEPNAHPSTRVNALVSSVADAQLAVDEGCTTIKLKVGMDDTADLHRVEAVARAVGPDVALRLDANGGWDLGACRGVPDGVSRGCRWNTAETNALAHRRGRAAGAGPHAHCGRAWLTDVMVAEDLVRNRRVDVLILKPAVLGGLIPSLALAQRAVSLGLRSMWSPARWTGRWPAWPRHTWLARFPANRAPRASPPATCFRVRPSRTSAPPPPRRHHTAGHARPGGLRLQPRALPCSPGRAGDASVASTGVLQRHAQLRAAGCPALDGWVRCLAQQGISAGDRVALLSHNSGDLVPSWWP